MTAPDPAGLWEEAAVRAALQEAGLAPAEIDLVAAHGTGTLLNDAMEARLLARIYGGPDTARDCLEVLDRPPFGGLRRRGNGPLPHLDAKRLSAGDQEPD